MPKPSSMQRTRSHISYLFRHLVPVIVAPLLLARCSSSSGDSDGAKSSCQRDSDCADDDHCNQGQGRCVQRQADRCYRITCVSLPRRQGSHPGGVLMYTGPNAGRFLVGCHRQFAEVFISRRVDPARSPSAQEGSDLHRIHFRIRVPGAPASTDRRAEAPAARDMLPRKAALTPRPSTACSAFCLGANYQNRTGDLRFTKPLLYRLS